MSGRVRRSRTTVLAATTAALVGLGAITAAPAQAAPEPAPTSSSPAPSLAPAQPWPVGDALSAAVQGEAVLTLPGGDGLRDSVALRVRSGARGKVEVVAHRGKQDLPVAVGALKRTGTGWQRTLRVPVTDLGRGRWTLIARRVATPEIRAKAPVVVGSGKPVAVVVAPVSRTVYPFRDGSLDAVDATVTAADETGAALPVRGTLRLDLGKKHRERTLQAGRARIPVTALPFGTARLTAAIRTAGGEAKRLTAVTLAPTAVGALRLARSADTVQPVADGLLDSVTLTTSGAASGDSPARVRGALTVTDAAGTVVQRWSVPDGTARTFSWNGRVNGVIVPGVYTVALTVRGPEGAAKVRTKTLTVTKDHLPYRVRDLFTVGTGDQQGLAVHQGLFYVATDVGSGSARIDVWNGSGGLVRSLGALPIGHGASLGFSTTTGQLYAANGGPTAPTVVYELDPAATDPAAAIRRTIDLSSLGPNGMVAVDDAGGRLLVFAGAKGAYTLSSVAFDGTVQRTVPIAIEGTPQGLQMVGTELWVYTSLKGRNRLARYAVTDSAVIAASTGTAAFDLMNPGEGEGLSFSDGSTYVGAHGVNRVGVLEPVADE